MSQLPLSGDFDMYGVRFKDKPIANPADAPSAFRYGVTPGYIEAMGIPIRRGRSITDQDRAGTQPIILINELFAEETWPGEDPVGKSVHLGGPQMPWRVVAGVVGNVRHQGLDAQERKQLYVPEAQWPYPDSDMILAIRTTGGPERLAMAARETIWSVNRSIRITGVAPMADVIDASMAQRRFPRGCSESLRRPGCWWQRWASMCDGLHGHAAYHRNRRAHGRGLSRETCRAGCARDVLVGVGVVLGGAGALAWGDSSPGPFRSTTIGSGDAGYGGGGACRRRARGVLDSRPASRAS